MAKRSGLSVRSLERLFDEHIGVTPKWLIRQSRLHEATERAAAGVAVDWPALAGELGYADQSHFIREFASVVGTTPARYAAHRT